MNSSQIKWTFGPCLAVSAWIIVMTLAAPFTDLDIALLVEQLVIAIALVVIVRRVGRFDQAGWRSNAGYAWLWLAGPIWLAILTPLGLAAGNLAETPGRAPLWFACALLVGLNEETVFRGFLLNGLKGRIGAFGAALVSSALFGLVHAINALVGADSEFLVAQMAAAFGTGLVLSAVTLRAGSVWPAVFLHAAADAVGLSALGGFGAAVQTAEAQAGMFVFALLTAVWGVFWIWILRRRRTLEFASASA